MNECLKKLVYVIYSQMNSEYIGSYQILTNECMNIFATKKVTNILADEYIHKNIRVNFNIHILSKIPTIGITVNNHW